MIVSYRGTALDDSQVEWVESRQINRDDRLNRRSMLRRVTLNGFIKGDSAAELKTKINAINSLFATDGGDLILYHNGGVVISSHTLTSADSMTGVVVVSGPDYPSGSGVEYATERNYTVTLEATYALSNTDDLVAWQEQIRIAGTGGPRRVGVEFTTGSPEVQIVNQQTLMYAQQTGSAVGWSGYPTFWGPAAALAPYENGDRRTESAGTPTLIGGVFRNYPISWFYEFMGPSLPGVYPTAR